MEDLNMVAMWLIKKLCIDTNADKATYTVSMTHLGEPIGYYEIIIKKK